MMEERYHVTTQNQLYPDMSNVLVNKKYYSGGKTYQPTYVRLPQTSVTKAVPFLVNKMSKNFQS
jgi:hypothetical protein